MVTAFETQPGFFVVTKSDGLSRWLPWALLGAILLGASFFGDAAVQAWVTEHRVPWLWKFMRQVSLWGDWPTHFVVGLIGLGISYAKKNRRWIAICIAIIIASALAGTVNRVIKITTGRARPSVLVDSGWKGPRLSSKYHAFPSGHTASSVAFFTALLIARRRIGLALLPIPLLIATSRIYVNAHHLSDVVAGAIVGILCAALTWAFLSARFPDSAKGVS